jgi:hypothetical protein
MDVAAWLRGLGLGRYEQAFRDNEIDWEALAKLTAEDLKDLGVVPGATVASCSRPSPLCAAILVRSRRERWLRPRPSAGS